jgi:hypothetical protein
MLYWLCLIVNKRFYTCWSCPQYFGSELKGPKRNYKLAFSQYDKNFKLVSENKQRIAKNRLCLKVILKIWTCNVKVKLKVLPFISKLFIKQFSDSWMNRICLISKY